MLYHHDANHLQRNCPGERKETKGKCCFYVSKRVSKSFSTDRRTDNPIERNKLITSMAFCTVMPDICHISAWPNYYPNAGRAGGRTPRTSGRGGLTHAQGPHVAWESRSGHTKMRKICWSPELRPGHRWGSYLTVFFCILRIYDHISAIQYINVFNLTVWASWSHDRELSVKLSCLTENNFIIRQLYKNCY